MRIGIDASTWSNKRGFGRLTRELLKALITLDYENNYLLFVDRNTALTNDLSDDATVIVAPTHVSPMEAASASGRRSLRDLFTMTQTVWKHELDLFFYPAVYSYYPIFNRAKVIVTIPDMTPERYPSEVFPEKKLRLFWKLKQYLAIQQAHLILTISEYSKQDILTFCKVPESRVSVVSCAPNTDFTSLPHDSKMVQALHRYELDSSTRFLLYVGGISPHKNLRLLVAVYQQLTSDPMFSDVKLLLVGDYRHDSFYSDYPTLQALVNKLRLENKVVFTGYIEDKDLAYLYNAASLLVFPSLQEGFGLPAVEAMVCGCPVAASNLGSLPEVLGDAGCFFDPYNKEEMLGVIKKVLSDNDLRESMKSKGLDRAKQFSWEKAARDLLSIFHNVVDGNQRQRC